MLGHLMLMHLLLSHLMLTHLFFLSLLILFLFPSLDFSVVLFLFLFPLNVVILKNLQPGLSGGKPDKLEKELAYRPCAGPP